MSNNNSESRMLPVKYSAKDNELRALKNRVKYLNDLYEETLKVNEKLRKEKKDLETMLLEKNVEIDVLKETNTKLKEDIEFINEIEKY